MTDKKIIITAVILALLLVGAGWYFSKNPSPADILNSPTPSLALEQGITVGNPDAPVTIDIYTNFMCPACKSFATTAMENIKTEYVNTGKVKLNFIIYPPQELSRAALCAQEQNKFNEFHDYVFAHQEEITSGEDIITFATNAGLDSAKFNACYTNADSYKDKIDKWYADGETRGVDATPTFFINGQKFIGAQPFAEFKTIIDAKLAQ
jgi:protein-disulfide isomerase